MAITALAAGVVGVGANIPIPQVVITPLPLTSQPVIGQEFELAVTFDNTVIIGYSPFLQLYVPLGDMCYTFISARSSYEKFEPMPKPIIDTFVVDSCVGDSAISNLPPDGNCPAAAQTCGKVNSSRLITT